MKLSKSSIITAALLVIMFGLVALNPVGWNIVHRDGEPAFSVD